MSCRTTPAGSAFTTYARLVVGDGMPDVACLSAFHELRDIYRRRDPESRRTYTRDDYLALIERQRARVQRSTTITDARRASILRRLDAAAAADTPDQSTLYALHNVTPHVRQRAESIRGFLTNVASQTGTTYEDVSTRFWEIAERADGRGSSALTDTAREAAASAGLGREARMAYAASMLTEEAREITRRRAAAAPPRITREPLAQPQSCGIRGRQMTSFGYDITDRRLEVELSDGTVMAYHSVPLEIVQRMRADGGAAAGSVWSRNVRSTPAYQYATEEDAVLAGAAQRCGTCGQFADASHGCPRPNQARTMNRWNGRSRWSQQRVTRRIVNRNGEEVDTQFSVRLPAIRELRDTVGTGRTITIDVNEWMNIPDPTGYSHGRVYGEMEIATAQDGRISVAPRTARCSCEEYRNVGTCAHLQVVSDAIAIRLDPASDRAPSRPIRSPEETERMIRAAQERLEREAAERAARIAAARENAMQSDWTTNPTSMEEAERLWREGAEVVYSEDPDAFVAAYRQAEAAKAANNGAPAIPYMRENALDGLAQRGSGKAFGMEIEYDFPDSMTYEEKNRANVQIGRELYEAGLTYSRDQQGYGASRRFGFRDYHTDGSGVGTWSFERDGSVAGELVTPGMYDEPETWERLEKAVEILRRNGAVASKRAGAHVHVGTGDFSGNPAAYTELARMMTQHEDVMFRLASNPERGTHRNGGTGYSTSMPPVPAEGFSDVGRARSWQPGRAAALNLYNVSGGAGDHPEFRVFDASLDPGTMQTQIKVAVAMTEAANRAAAAGGTTRRAEPVGVHYIRSGGTDPSDDAGLVAETGTARSLLDTLFRRRADKEQAVALFAHTKWVERDPESMTF